MSKVTILISDISFEVRIFDLRFTSLLMWLCEGLWDNCITLQ